MESSAFASGAINGTGACPSNGIAGGPDTGARAGDMAQVPVLVALVLILALAALLLLPSFVA